MSILLLVSVIPLAALWVRSYVTQDELRWLSGGVHRHIESAGGYLTVVSTSGCASGDYFVWASSPDLSYGRTSNWYEADPAGPSRWQLRIHYSIPSFASSLVLLWVWREPVRNPPTRHEHDAAG